MKLSQKYLILIVLSTTLHLLAQKNAFEFSLAYVGDKNLNTNITNLGELLPAPIIDNRIAFQAAIGYERKINSILSVNIHRRNVSS